MELTDADVAWCSRSARYWYLRLDASPCTYQETVDACIDGMMKAQTTYDVTKGMAWRTWLTFCMRVAVLEMRRQEKLQTWRRQEVVRGLSRRHRRFRRLDPPAEFRHIEEQHDLAAFARWLARQRTKTKNRESLQCLQLLQEGMRAVEMAHAAGVTEGAIAIRLTKLRQQWHAWEERGDGPKQKESTAVGDHPTAANNGAAGQRPD